MSRAEPAPSATRPAIAVFCGARPGNDPRYLALAHAAGMGLARHGFTVVYGGGSVGMMGALAEGALGAGGEVIGVIPKVLVAREVGHTRLTRLEVVPDMSVRKKRMNTLASGYLILPGGLGTLDELFEVLTLRQIGLHEHPVVAVSEGGYFDSLAAALQGFVAAGLAARQNVEALELYPDLDAALTRLAAVCRHP